MQIAGKAFDEFTVFRVAMLASIRSMVWAAAGDVRG
jgi:hypothetical protein